MLSEEVCLIRCFHALGWKYGEEVHLWKLSVSLFDLKPRVIEMEFVSLEGFCTFVDCYVYDSIMLWYF